MYDRNIYGVIYKITNKVNKKVYIGQTTRGFDKRYNNRWWYYTSNTYLKNSAVKYGVHNFEVVKVFDTARTKEELDKKEKYWISYYKSNFSDSGYNLDDGGSNGKPNSLAKSKMSLAKQGALNNRYGVKLSEDTKERIRLSNKGKQSGINHPLFGKKRDKVWRKNHSKRMEGENHPLFGKYGSNNPKSKSVICLTTNEIFGSIKEALIAYKISSKSGVSDCCKGIRKSAGKHPITDEKLKWMYLEDYEKQFGKIHNDQNELHKEVI